MVLMQNSGLGHCLNALTSLAFLYRIPLLLVVGWRGAKEGDAPEHVLMGSATPSLLTAASIPFWSPVRDDVCSALRSASLKIRSEGLPAALLIRETVFS
jgi:sulfopyruvate decarboxylase subunit alpha